MTVQEAFARNLSMCLAERHLSAYQLEAESGITQTTIYSYTNSNNRTPNLHSAYKIAKALGVTIDSLLEGCDE